MSSMFKHLRSLLAALVLVSSFSLAVVQTQPSFAAPVDVLTKCNNESKVCAGTDKNSLYGLMNQVINLLLIIIGIISIIMIIIGGIRYTTSAGDAGQTKSARDTVIYAVVGLVIAIMSFAIVNFVLSRI